MAQTTGISWTDATWNPWHGCRKISAGCKYCYMFRDKERYGQDPTVVMRSKSNFNDPLKWAMDTEQIGFLPGKDKEPSAFVGMKIFTCSWSDFFIQEADEWRADAWNIIRDTPEFTYQILTKRPERIMECLPPDWGRGYENVWLGVSVEDKAALTRIEILSNVPAKLRFISFEPLLEYIIFGDYIDCLIDYDWAIIGGESGNESGKYRYRPCDANWIGNIATKLRKYGVTVFVKQLGTQLAKEMRLKSRHGQHITEWPQWLQYQEFPKNRRAEVAQPDSETTEWLCTCGHFQPNGWHCGNCGNQPPWGCDCSDCSYSDPDEDEDYFQTVWSKFDHIPYNKPDNNDPETDYLCDCGATLTKAEFESNGRCDDCLMQYD